MTVYLLDINLLLALSDPMHMHNEPSLQWFDQKGQYGWATCPLTENGYLRIASNPNYGNRPGGIPAVYASLQQFIELLGHEFWPDDVSIFDLLKPESILTHHQITDVYLLGLAYHHKGKLATLDRRIPAAAVFGGKETLEIVPFE